MSVMTAALLVGLFVVGASAAGSCTEHSAAIALTEIDGDLAEGTYYLSADITAMSNVTVSGDATLRLNDKILTAAAYTIQALSP